MDQETTAFRVESNDPDQIAEAMLELQEDLEDLDDLAPHLPGYKVGRRLVRVLDKYFPNVEDLVEKLNVSDREKRTEGNGTGG